MSDVGQREKETQKRVIRLLVDGLGYRYLGDWTDREGNANIEPDLLRDWLTKQGHRETLINKAMRALETTANDQSLSFYDRNKAVYALLRYGVKVSAGVGKGFKTVDLIRWDEPELNDFAVAEEVTVGAANARANGKRPDLVLYVNGIALGVLELKRSTVSVAEGIRQNLDNQEPHFIQPFFSTIQLIMAGNDPEGLRYGVIETPEKYYMEWKEASPLEKKLDRGLTQLCSKARLLEIIHDFIVFDSGTKKIARHNQYFGVRAAQEAIRRREGGIIWHTQGSGKSLTMVWLAKWIREHQTNARILLITDRTELDEQIEKVFLGVDEKIYRTTSGADLIAQLNEAEPPLICSLIHKFRGKEEPDIEDYLADLKAALPLNFRAKSDLYVFVDECHRTQSGDLHKAMKAILPDAMFIGFTGTPLLKKDKRTSREVFGPYIHEYRWDEAVGDHVVVDLRYEARDIDQHITSPEKIDQWFESSTRGLTDLAKAQLKAKWGTMRRVLSSRSRLEMIVQDILMDMATKPRLMDGRGNAMLVSGSIYSACKFYELFDQTDLKGKCAIITSYQPSVADIKGEETGEGTTEKLRQYGIYRKMLADWFNEPEEKAGGKVELFEEQAKERFIKQPGQMRLLIVVDKLLTGFDAPSATYLYIDKKMQDHGLFQAICRVNRLDGEDKDYGFIVDYKDLFKSLETAVKDYTSGGLDGYEKGDIDGLLKDRVSKAKEDLEEALEAIRALCEPVKPPHDMLDYTRFFCAEESGNADQLKENEPKRLKLYKYTAALLRVYANVANDLENAGYNKQAIADLEQEVHHFDKVRTVVKLDSGDYIDLKRHEPAMRHLIDSYIRAEESKKVSAFDDMSLIDLIVERGPDAVKELPASIRNNKEAVAETIENNVRRLIIDETPVNPKYYENMSQLLDALIAERRKEAISYERYLAEIASLTRRIKAPGGGGTYPAVLNTAAKRSLYDNLGKDEPKAIRVDEAIRNSRQDAWRDYAPRLKQVRIAIQAVLQDEALTETILNLAKKQSEY